jgi:hypothetical protein
MRTHRWLKALAFGCCLGAGADAAFAQAPFAGGEGNWITADGSPAPAPYPPQMPGMYQAPYGTNDPGVLYPPGTPPSFAPWPQISPYGMGNYSYDTHYNQGGTWFREILNKRRDYYFNVNALSTTTRGPGHATIGAQPVKLDDVTRGPAGYPLPTYGEAAFPGATTGGTGTGGGTNTATGPTPASRVYIDDGIYPYPYMRPSTTGTPASTVDNNLFPIRSTRLFNEFNSPGIQLEWGFEEEDGSGLKLDAWWGFSSDQTFQRGTDSIDGVVIDQQLIFNTEGQFLFSRNGAVTYDTGIVLTPFQAVDAQGLFGATLGAQKYDVMYRVNVQSQAGGGDLQLMMPDLLPSTSAIRLRPVYGGKYTFIGESFDFRGIDSGMSYNVVGGATGGGTGGGTGGTNTGATFRPVPWGTTGPNSIDSDLFETQVSSRTRSHLAGPMAGLRYDFGRSRNFKIWGQSSAGLMANYEQVRVNGFNAGENLITRLLLGTNMLDGDSSFSDSETHAHVSPVFEQTFMSESKILAALPGTREIPILANANFRLGYTTTIIGNVARPADSIEWNGFPKSPKVDIDYMTWSMGRVNVGLEWTY